MQLTRPLHKALQERPDATGLVCGEHRQRFAEFVHRVSRLAAVLRSFGVVDGERVGMLALNSDRYVEFLCATWWAGGVINPVNIRWSPREIAYSLDDCDTTVLLVDEQFAPVAARLPTLSRSLCTLIYIGDGTAPDGMQPGQALIDAATPVDDACRHGDQLAAVMYTGGTTGLPKGVMLSHANLVIGSLSANMAARRPDEAVGINAAPMFHVGGVGLAVQLMMRLCKQVVMPLFDEPAPLQAIQAERGSETFLVPTMIKRLIEHPRVAEFDTSSLELVLYGAAPIDEALLAQAMAALPRAGFCQLYGMTELSPVITALPAWCHAPGQPTQRLRSAGRPVPIAEMRLVDADGRPVPAGTVGEIAARGPMARCSCTAAWA